MTTFLDDEDHIVFLAFLERASRKHAVEIHGYVLMSNHLHLLATPQEPGALPGLMKVATGDYCRFFNDKYERIGTIWNGRYRPLLITDAYYWLTCLRYIEQNPVRASMVSHPGDYRWSSYAAHALGCRPDWLVAHPIYLALGSTAETRQLAYQGLCRLPLSTSQAVGVRHPSDPKRRRGQTGV